MRGVAFLIELPLQFEIIVGQYVFVNYSYLSNKRVHSWQKCFIRFGLYGVKWP